MENDTSSQLQDEEKIALRDLLKPYILRWYWLILGAVVAVIIAWFFLRYSIPVYNTQSTILIKEVKKSTSSQPDMSVISEISGLGSMSTNSVDNEIEIFKSRKLMLSVVRELGIETSIFREGNIKDSELYKETSPFIVRVINENKKAAFPQEPVQVQLHGNEITLSSEFLPKKIITSFGKTISLPFGTYLIQKNPQYNFKKESDGNYKMQFMSGMSRTLGLLSQLSVKLVDDDATVILLGMNHSVPEKAEDVLKRLAIDYNRDASLDKNSEAQKTADFIEDRIRIIARELGEVENQKENFKVENKIADIASEAEISLQSISHGKQEQLENESQLELVNSLLGYMNNQNSYQVLPLNVGLTNPDTSSNIALFNQLVIERNRLLENSTPANPVVQDVTKQINSMRSSIVSSLQKTLSGLQIKRNNLLNEQNKVAGRISKIPLQEKLFRSIERQQNIKEQLYLLLLQKREEAAISLAIAAPKARVVDDPLTSGIPVSPKRQIIYLAALLVGLLIPLGIIYLIELFNNRIKSKKDLEKLLQGGTVIGELPRIGNDQPDIVQVNDLSPMAEAFRILITNMNFMLPKNKKGHVVFVTSSVKGEGKTFTSVNLALTLATPRKKVIIIGSDIRNPQLQRYNESRKGLKGITEYMYDQEIKADEIIHRSTFNPHCDVIYSGSIAPNPTDLLSNGRYQELVESLKDRYDYIVLDTAPLMLVTDSFLIVDTADVVVYVVRSEYTPKDLIDFANKQIYEGKIKNVGFVLNDVSNTEGGYGYNYGYGYGYSAKEKQSWWKKIFRF
ncbi:GumC family protein [Chryseobacterium daecheongense]|uniref:non-specific protein-tyrosine kinase n=1 Tax=Chryseobacterium daecheongense TaxID=192389 RepID=A0A3N0W667_9FLAO|nr:polysaccharide biosynthesis tyrosine autokinase [Chryseobacterium daecheongense]ROI00547.1 polysaccharide biosynthesis tyrosine autokinase [Chryseobacterium daecheongense]TDX94474.1 capsular exopolysaccharide synthesis family protein [Chryseobacterium daecheongense]